MAQDVHHFTTRGGDTVTIVLAQVDHRAIAEHLAHRAQRSDLDHMTAMGGAIVATVIRTKAR